MPGFTRREFNALLLGAASALCGGCAAGRPTLTPMGGQVLLSFAQFPVLAAVGGAAVVDVQGQFPIAVVRTGESVAAALSATCTHQACIVRYDRGANDLHCDCHDADFALDGTVLGGPTVVPLPTYAATVGADGIRVDLT